MANEIIPYLEMCQREGVSLQRGMTFELQGHHSVILMSVRPNALYAERLEDNGTTLIYEGHDVPRSRQNPNPKVVDQPGYTPSGPLQQNGMFCQAAHRYRDGLREPERVRVYEKIEQGIWSYNGILHLVDAWQESRGGRKVFKFKLVAVEGKEDPSVPAAEQATPRRIIPTWAEGGSSLTPKNVQLFCSTHNLLKHDKRKLSTNNRFKHISNSSRGIGER